MRKDILNTDVFENSANYDIQGRESGEAQKAIKASA